MYDFLSYVERNFGCVAEYYRSMEDDAAHEAELRAEQEDYYARNRSRLDEAEKAGSYVTWAFECVGCPHYTAIGQLDSEDDVEHGICGDISVTDCDYRKKYMDEPDEADEVTANSSYTPCDDVGEDGLHHCPYESTYSGYEDEMCRNCCGLGADE